MLVNKKIFGVTDSVGLLVEREPLGLVAPDSILGSQ